MTDAQSREIKLFDACQAAAEYIGGRSAGSREFWDLYEAATAVPSAHPTPQRGEHTTRMLDQLSGGVGTFLQADGEKLVEFVRGLERTIEIAHGDLDMHEGLIADLKRQLAERDAEIEQLKENVSARSRLQP